MSLRFSIPVTDYEQMWLDYILHGCGAVHVDPFLRSRLDKALERARAERDGPQAQVISPYGDLYSKEYKTDTTPAKIPRYSLYRTQPESRDRIEFDGFVVTANHPGAWPNEPVTVPEPDPGAATVNKN